MPPAAGKVKDETQQSFFESLYHERESDANEIADGLFLGAAKAAGDRQAMLKRKITHVLIAHPTMKEDHPKHFKYGRAPLIDVPNFNLLEKIPDALRFLREARSQGGKVFVYCAKGISRSSSLVIALLMLEQGIGFDEAWSMCEKKRPIVYPNVGFQQQLRYLEKLMTKVDLKVPWERQLKQLDLVVPIGDLEAPESPLPIRDAIGSVMGEALEALEALVDKVQSQPQLLQKRELWKRQGMFFENMHKYKAIPGDAELLSRAKTAADRLRSLPNIFSDQLKGVKLALGVAKELEDWSKVAEKKLIKPVVVVEPVPVEGHPGLNMVGAVETGEREKVKKDKKDKDKDGKDGKDKKSKKERKFEKKQKKADKKLAKTLAKIEKAASQAELMAKESREESDKAAKICAELDAEEAEAEFEERNAAAARRSETVVERKRDREGEGRGDSPRRKRARSSSSEDEESSED